jgi:hypothetical protein
MVRPRIRRKAGRKGKLLLSTAKLIKSERMYSMKLSKHLVEEIMRWEEGDQIFAKPNVKENKIELCFTGESEPLYAGKNLEITDEDGNIIETKTNLDVIRLIPKGRMRKGDNQKFIKKKVSS